MPPQDAAPEPVVQTYLDALDAHDCATANALFPTGNHDECRNVNTIRNVKLHVPTKAPSPEALRTSVGADSQLRWRWIHTDPTLTGSVIWGYFLTRKAPDSPWVITGEGVG